MSAQPTAGDEDRIVDLYVTDQATGRDYYVETGSHLSLHVKAMDMVAAGRDAWTRDRKQPDKAIAPQPTAGAMRAAVALQNQFSIGHWAGKWKEEEFVHEGTPGPIAYIIDRETGVAELVAALREAAGMKMLEAGDALRRPQMIGGEDLREALAAACESKAGEWAAILAKHAPESKPDENAVRFGTAGILKSRKEQGLI